MDWKPSPIIGAAYADDCKPWADQDLCNYIPVKAELPGARSNEIARSVPGLQEFATVPDVRKQRGGYVAEGRLLFVADTTLYQQMPNGSVRSLGTIPGTGRVTFAHNQIALGNEIAIATGSSGYIYNTATDTLTQITDDAFQGGKSVVFIDQMFVWIEPQGRQAFPSALADGLSYNGTEDFQGESKPDRIVGQIVNNGELVLLNEQSLDHFDSTGTTNNLFANKRIPMDRGCGAQFSICNLDQAVFFIGNDGNGYVKRGYQLQRITTHAIEQAWAKCDLSKAFAFTWEDRGHKVWYVTFGDGHTWGYDIATGKWHRRRSNGMNRWRLAWLVNWRGAWYGGEYNSGRIFRLDWDYMLEGSDEHPREGTSGVLHSDQNRVTLHGLQLVVDASGPETIASSVFALSIDGDVPDGDVADAVSYQYTVIGGTSPRVVTVTSGTLPPGLTMDVNGLVTGAFTTAGSYSWTVTVTDANGLTASVNDTCDVAETVASGLLAKLVLWSDFEETAGATAVEYIEGNTGAYTNCSHYTLAGPGTVGGIAKRFAGLGARVGFPQTSLNGIRTPGFVAFWFRKLHAENGVAFARGGQGGVGGEPAMTIAMGNDYAPILSEIVVGTIDFSGGSNYQHSPFNQYEYLDGNWHHFIWSHTHTGATYPWSGTQTKIYIDGALEYTATNQGGDEGPLYHATTAGYSSGTTQSNYNFGGQPGLGFGFGEGGAGNEGALWQAIAGNAAITDAEAAYLYNLGNGKRWAAFAAESGA